jgi:hypothetical protein
MRNWGGFQLFNLTRLNTEKELKEALRDLREWVDTTSSVKISIGGPNNAEYLLETANDLLAVPVDRRDACFSGVFQLLLFMKKIQKNSKDVVWQALKDRGHSSLVSWLRSRFMKRTVMVGGNVRWRDDGNHSVLQSKASVISVSHKQMDAIVARQEQTSSSPPP